ncbi:hypothetical protein [Arthrobacter castelli]|uniref:hypothetical protein n=1 Tax=Arthrobacter castelli TaxID=271431 RepID=UPI0004283A1A|nr:hypothetical protein [Arthrobacter castelli]
MTTDTTRQTGRCVVYNSEHGPYIIEPDATRTPVTTDRYKAAIATLEETWNNRPPAATAERANYEAHQMRPARAEVRSAWIDAAHQHGIPPDQH